MAIIGVSKPQYAIYAEESGTVTYSGGGSLGKMTEVSVEIESSEDNNLYADNGIAETDREFSGGTMTVTTDELSQEVSKVILGLKEEALGTIAGVDEEGLKELIYDDTQVIPYLGIGFIIKKKVNGIIKWRAIILTKVMFSVPSDAATTQGESIDWQTSELSGTIMKDGSTTHMWKRECTFATEAAADAYIKDRLSIAAPASQVLSGKE